MEKKLITEMKFMMERLESPRMTYTQYEKKRNNLIKEDGSANEILNWAKETFSDQLKKNPNAKISIEGDRIVFDNGSEIDFSGRRFYEAPHEYSVEDFNRMWREMYDDEKEGFVNAIKKYLVKVYGWDEI